MAPSPTGVLDSKEPKAPDKEEKPDLSKKVIAECNPEPGIGPQSEQVQVKFKYEIIATCSLSYVLNFGISFS